MNLFRSIKGRLILFSLCISLIPTAVITTIYYLNARSTVKKQTLDWLTAVAESRRLHLLTFMKAKKGRALDFSSDGFIRDSLETINHQGPDAGLTVEELNRHLLVNKKPLDRDLVEVFVTNLDGVVVSSTNEKTIGMDMSSDKDFLQGRGITHVKPPFHYTQAGVDCLSIFVPLITKELHEPIGVIVNVIKLEALSDITAEWDGMGETGEVYLVNRDGIMLTESRFTEGVVLKQVVDTEPISKRAYGEEMTGIYSNYMGVPVVGASACIPEYGWMLLTEISRAEALAPLKMLGIVALVIGLISAAAVASMGIIFATSTSRPIKRLTDATKRFADGDLKHRVKITRRDEIGTLAGSFNTMAEELAKEITERKQAEETLLESEEKFRNISASAQDAIIMINNEGNISYWNEAAEKIFNYSKEETVGKKLHKLIVPDKFLEKHLDGFRRFQDTGQGPAIGKTLELAALKRDRTEFPIELSLSAVKIKGKWNAIGIIRDITERKQAEEELEELAATDDLTGLFNRRRFYELLTHAMASAKRFGHPLSLLFFDLDNFKSYNDTYGHLEGDAVLKAIEGCAKRLIRQDIDFCCRYGGEEFTVILPETTKEMAFNVAERFRKEVEKLEFYPKTAKDASRPAKITISIGVAEFKNYDTDTFVNKADKAMYEAKKLGKNKVAISE